MLDALVGRISEHLTKAEQLNVERPYRLLKESLNAAFDVNLSKSIVLKEYGDAILGENLSNVPLLHYIKKVAYIDTPMVIGMETSSQQPIYWKELNLLLKQPPRRGYKRTINNIIKEDIIKGDVSFDEDGFSAGFKYKREDGKEFDLLECATGIKSFSLLQLLLKNLFLDESTLLIIDEPEAHLHPQWIVEYARLIVLLHKKVGVKFFIASHSTDMVSAIRYIAEEEKCLSSLSFYVAENEEQKSNAFVFRPLGHDIEPIFESFNKSFERLDYYVSKKKNDKEVVKRLYRGEKAIRNFVAGNSIMINCLDFIQTILKNEKYKEKKCPFDQEIALNLDKVEILVKKGHYEIKP